MVATSTGFKPFSKNLDVASWRKSWNLRFSNQCFLQKRLKAWVRCFGVYENRATCRIGKTFCEVLSCSLMASIALDDNGIVRGVSVLVIGMRRVCWTKSIWLFLMFSISPLRIPVSSAMMMIRLSSSETDKSFSSSPASNLLSLPLPTLGKETIDSSLLWFLATSFSYHSISDPTVSLSCGQMQIWRSISASVTFAQLLATDKLEKVLDIVW